MTTRPTTRDNPAVRVLHSVSIREPKDAACTERLEEPYDLAGATYRVVLGCCTQEESTRNTNPRRLAPAKATTIVRAKEVIS
jgi:hypothetical protein